jgi:flagellar motor switch protein FliN/FliY
MTQQDVTPREALIRLGASAAEAIAQVLDNFFPGKVERGEVTVLADGAAPFANVARGSIASSVSYVDGVTGANILVLNPVGARKLAIAMGAPAGEGPVGAGLSELEMSAIAEAANQTMAAAAAAIGVVIGQQIAISTPDTRVLDDPGSAADIYGTAPHSTTTTFKIAGESCRLIQLVPSGFVVRMVRAMDELTAEQAGAGHGLDGAESPHSRTLQEALGGINLRVWAELGRTHMPLGRALGLPVGAVVDLDRAADAPVDLYVNGTRFARGRLLVTDDGEWAVSLDEVIAKVPLKLHREVVEIEPEELDYETEEPIDAERQAPGPAEMEDQEDPADDADDTEIADVSGDASDIEAPDAVQPEGAVT